MTLTPKREQEIRLYSAEFHHNGGALQNYDPEKAVEELLTEIDRLRAENKAFRFMNSDLLRRIQHLVTENKE